MKQMKKMMCAVIAAVMSVSLLAGCGGSASSGSSAGSGSSSGSPSSTASSSDMGRYVEKNLGNPFNEAPSEEPASSETEETAAEVSSYATSGSGITALSVLKDGSLRALVSYYSNGSYKLFASSDNGQTWQDQKVDFSKVGNLGYNAAEAEEDGAGESGSISNVSFDGDGNMFFDFQTYKYTGTSSDETHTYYIMGADGTFKEADFEIPNVPKTQHYDYDEDYSEGEDITVESEMPEDESEDDIVISESGDMGDQPADDYYYSGYLNNVKLVDVEHLYVSSDNNLYLISIPDGKVLQTINDFDYVSNMIVCGDQLIVSSYDKTIAYELATGKKKGEIEGFSQIMTAARSNFLVSGSYDDPSALFYCDSDGIYRYDLTSGENKQIVDGALTSLVDPECYISNFLVCKDDVFLAASDSGTEGASVLYYAYDADVPARPEKSVRIYALTDNYTLRQVVSGFQKAHQDIYVTYEWGMTGEDAVTVSDAMRTLNTEIMGGNGPDIILLDGLSVENYISKGVLADVSDVVQPLIDDGKLFENQAGTYKDSKGVINAVPMTFSYPMMIGEQEYLDNVKSISDLADKAEEFAKTNKNENVSFMEAYSLSMLPMAFVPVCSNWYAEDGTLNADELRSTLEDLKRLYDAVYKSLSKDAQQNVDSMNEYYTSEDMGDIDISGGAWVSDPSNDALYITGGVYKVGVGFLQSADSLQNITSAMRVNKKLGYTSMPGSDGNIYVPNNIIGVNARSKDLETAKSFLAYMLGDSAQKAYSQMYSGFPINKTVFDNLFVNPYVGEDWYDPKEPLSGMGMTDENGKEFTLNIFWPSDEEIAQFKEKVDKLDTASSKNNQVMNTIFRDSLPYFTGSTSLDDTVSKIQKDIQIYLSE